ncbi:MAG: hypothetical protein EOP53_10220 [Sphingobacteriales bacterium]|nr:MAG: hypothetical protein EOP53_10220 [Sphingobacteriales bacterium]
MIELILGSLVLSLIHAAIPNHWVPLVLISRAEGWKLYETLLATALTGFAHILSTVLLGLVIGMVGYKLSGSYGHISHIIAPLILILMGIIYLGFHSGNHRHEHLPSEEKLAKKKSKSAILLTLFTAMFFSPCMEIGTYYFTAGTYGLQGIFLVSGIYLFATISMMVILVAFAYKGIERFKWHFLEHHEKKITGITLIIIGALSFFIH